ncbi:ATP-binding protein [Methylobacterium sp. 10]|uniref:ATP-binding protein n=1 Tax=Methylobacterium sp. 10 TaxID=1101191 RepID=UPI0004B6073D|nr:ATP-binding protein [Methylobacterium sp. 10]
MVLAGWWLDVPIMRSLFPGEPPMVALTALACVLIGASLLLATRTPPSSTGRVAERSLAGAAGILALGGGLQYAIPGSFRLDDWVQRLLFAPLKPGSGMAIPTVLCILATVAGILLQDAEDRRLRHLGGLSSLCAFVIATACGIGYAYGLGSFHQGGPYSRMALVTAVTLGSLSGGVLLSRPDRPWVRTAFGRGEAGAVTRHLLPAVVVVPLVLGWLELHAVRNGVMEAETGTALLVIVLVTGLAGLTVRLARDVDRRVATELRLRDTLQGMNDTLRQRVDERTRELSEAQAALLQSQKMDAVGQLTGGVAHDFNNLLTIIRSSVEFLRRPDLTEERRRRYMDAVSDTVDRAAKLTAQLLAFARRQALKPEVFDVGARVRSVADMLDSLTGARIRIVTHLPAIACHVRADVSQFETALVNLAVNARDAMGGEGTLTIRVVYNRPMPAIRGHAPSTGPFVCVEVSDTGSGIPAENLGPIFEPFFTTKDIGKGTGLGLSQVIGFTKQSGGDVDVGSVVGHGTTFALYLPEAGAEADAADIDIEPEGAPVEQGGRCILIVEDNVEVGQFCAQILHDLGYATVLVHSAEAALAEIEALPFRFDAVFSDVVMPGMGGIGLANRLREIHPDLQVILTSGYSHVLAQDGDHGFDLVRKPYSAAEVGTALSHAAVRRSKLRAKSVPEA